MLYLKVSHHSPFTNIADLPKLHTITYGNNALAGSTSPENSEKIRNRQVPNNTLIMRSMRLPDISFKLIVYILTFRSSFTYVFGL